MRELPKWYSSRLEEKVLFRTLQNRLGNGTVGALIIEGAPGVGKTAFARAAAEALGGSFLYFLSHHWLSEEELFYGIDVGKAVVGVENPEEVYKPGILLQAVESSKQGMTVLCLDELDKAPERVEGLLLDFLQTGKVQGINGQTFQANLTQLAIIITTNGMRPLSEPLQRRCARLRMKCLDPVVEADILRKNTGASNPLCKLVVNLMTTIREKGESTPSLQEGTYFLQDLKLAQSFEEVGVLIDAWFIKEDDDRKALYPEKGAVQWPRIIWAEELRRR